MKADVDVICPHCGYKAEVATKMLDDGKKA